MSVASQKLSFHFSFLNAYSHLFCLTLRNLVDWAAIQGTRARLEYLYSLMTRTLLCNHDWFNLIEQYHKPLKANNKKNKQKKPSIDTAEAHLCQLTGWFGRWWVSPPGRPPSPPASEHTWRAAHHLCASILPPALPFPPSRWCRWRRIHQDRRVHRTGPHFSHFSKPSEIRDKRDKWTQEPQFWWAAMPSFHEKKKTRLSSYCFQN